MADAFDDHVYAVDERAGQTNGRSVEERADEEQEELFEKGVLDGGALGLGNFVKRNRPNPLFLKIGSIEVPMRGGLLDPDDTYRFAVTVRPDGPTPKPVRERQPDNTHRVVGYKTVQAAPAVYAEPLGRPRESVLSEFEKLIATNGQEAMKVAQLVAERAAEYLRNGEHR